MLRAIPVTNCHAVARRKNGAVCLQCEIRRRKMIEDTLIQLGVLLVSLTAAEME